MTSAAVIVVGLLNLAVLGTVVVLLRALLGTLRGIEDAVWHVGEELRGGVGLRIGRSRTVRPDRAVKKQATELDAPAEAAEFG